MVARKNIFYFLKEPERLKALQSILKSRFKLGILFVVAVCLILVLVGPQLYGLASQSDLFYNSSISSSSIPYLNLSKQLADKLHDHMFDSSAGAYYYEVSSNWATVVNSEFSTLGNAFIVAGLLQLYQATQNKTYLKWASGDAQQFWSKAWDSKNQGFYDTYSTSWSQTSSCQQTTQNNALWEIDFLTLSHANGSSVWKTRATSVETLLNSRFWSTANNIVEVSSNVCKRTQSGDVQIELSIGSYLWATALWSQMDKSSKYDSRMNAVAQFAWNHLWDSSSNTLGAGTKSNGCTTNKNYLGFMRSAYANLSGLEDCRKGANENIWGAVGLAYLYSINKNATIKSWVTQDLNWINQTFWDKSLGGYHQNAFRNDTLRSACSSTNNARDYPGWTQGEQPMFWWQIGQLLNNNTMKHWALVSEQWTAQHQWNSTKSNGGEMTCLNSNGTPDLGSVNGNLFDWIQASALYSYSTL
jgi:hypothetical protein